MTISMERRTRHVGQSPSLKAARYVHRRRLYLMLYIAFWLVLLIVQVLR